MPVGGHTFFSGGLCRQGVEPCVESFEGDDRSAVWVAGFEFAARYGLIDHAAGPADEFGGFGDRVADTVRFRRRSCAHAAAFASVAGGDATSTTSLSDSP